MKQPRFTEAQIIGILKEQKSGSPTAEVCRKQGVSPATVYKYQGRFGALEVSEAQRLKAHCNNGFPVGCSNGLPSGP
jgi:putative transposase